MTLQEIEETMHILRRAQITIASVVIAGAVATSAWGQVHDLNIGGSHQVVRSDPETAYDKTFLDTIMDFQPVED